MEESPRGGRRPSGRLNRAGDLGFGAAAAVGVVHGLFSLYWGFGGTWLVSTLGQGIVGTFAGLRWLIALVGLAKIGFAVVPLWWSTHGWPWRRPARLLLWVAALVLAAYGGANTVVANLILGGIIRPGPGYDHDGMIGHAWLWDPLFLVWGLALVVGLLATRRGRARSAAREPVDSSV